MTRLTEVSPELKESQSDIVEIEPFQAEETTPSILPTQSHTRLPALLKRFRRLKTGRTKFQSALELVRAAASLQPGGEYPIESTRTRLKRSLGRVLFSGYILSTLIVSPLIIAEVFPSATPIVTLLLFACVLLYCLLILRLSNLPAKRVAAALETLDYSRALKILTEADRFFAGSFVPPRAEILLATGRFAEAECWIRSTLLSKRFGKKIVDVFRYARALKGLGHNDYAEKLLLLSAELLPDGEPLIALSDLMLKRRGSPLDVLDLLDAALKRTEDASPEFLALHHARIAWAMARLNEIEESDRLLNRAYEAAENESKSTIARLHLIRAEILFDRGKRLESAAAAKECLETDPDGPTHGDARLLLVAASLRESEHRQQLSSSGIR